MILNTCMDVNTDSEATSEDNATEVSTGYQYNYTGLHFNIVTVQVWYGCIVDR